MTDSNLNGRNLIYVLFAVSGFSGLLYESIWSHYLKLFLGHAAYAQTLVLAIFMGGMAIGAWILSRYGTRWKNLLMGYALVEGIIGLSAMAFHGLFVQTTDLAYDTLIPALGSPWTINLLKWSLAALLILPQSILLGMTFPLMSASLIRRHPANPGANLAMLYFTNSFGAAIGVLVSGFVLIESVGLPGTILTAGLINIVLALIVWRLAKHGPEPAVAPTPKNRTPDKGYASWRLLITVSLLTGAASFIYEIGWIRMLSLVLGTSTHAFELMLSAFIVGLAFGGLWMRRRIDGIENPERFLAWIQITMGLLALATLIAYNASFDVMQLFMRALTRTESGYFFFNIASHGIAVFVMVPVTFCAGMTLPLITHTLLRRGYGEKSIGAVYAANTIGAIAGVFFAVHIGMPALGLKGLIATGAAIDMALGVALLRAISKRDDRRSVPAALILAVTALTAVLIGVEFDRYKMASGIYRYGAFFDPGSVEILYHKDGKTATVDLVKAHDGSINISTNGKSDAKINMSENGRPTEDEATMTLIGALPLVLHPRARTAANIGMGSGLTAHVLASGGNLEQVDTIEIEPAMIEAAHGFRPRVEAAFSDSRSRFYIDDAKTFFSANKSRYDIIISEPSNPWVSGVAGLFSDEFYGRVRNHLNANGLFVQWVQLYEINIDLVASVMKAIGRNFSDYSLYAANDADLVIVAVKDGTVPAINEQTVLKKELGEALRRIDVQVLQDLRLRRIGNRALLEPFFDSVPIAVNSDFFPILDLHAVRTRFLYSNANELISLSSAALPAFEMLGAKTFRVAAIPPTPGSHLSRSRWAHTAAGIRDFYANGMLEKIEVIDPNLLRHVLLTGQMARKCRGEHTASLWLESVMKVLNAVMPYLKPTETQSLWERFHTSDCRSQLSPAQKDYFTLLGAIARRDSKNMATMAEKLLAIPDMPREQGRYLVAAGMLGHLANNERQLAQRLWKTYAARIIGPEPPDTLLRFLLAHSTHADRRQDKTGAR